jgi:hypothetical protein
MWPHTAKALRVTVKPPSEMTVLAMMLFLLSTIHPSRAIPSYIFHKQEIKKANPTGLASASG